jgi:PAS domain S-box-containing protein
MESRKIKILAIDNNQDNLVTIKALILGAFPDASIMTALTITKGFELAVAEDPDVILLDIDMSIMDGFELCKKLKADEKLGNIPIVLVTSITEDKESRIKALECGVEAFLAKPIDKSELIAQIRAMVKIKTANIEKHTEKERLAYLLNKQTDELQATHRATLNLLEDLRKENDSRRKSQEALRESEINLRSTFDQSPVGSVIVGLDKRFIRCNSAFCNFLGYTEDELIGKTVADVTWPDDKDLGMPDMKLMVEGKKDSSTLQKRYVRKDGSIVWGEITISLVRDTENKPKYFLSIIQDITDRKQAEEKLIRSEEKYRMFIDLAPDAFFLGDDAGNFIVVNNSAVKLTGYTHDELKKMNINDLFPNNFNKSKPLRYDLLDNGETLKNERKLIRKDGQAVFVDMNSKRLPDGTYQSFIRDITERRQAEEKVQNIARLYALLSHINQAIIRTQEQNELFIIICQVAIEFGKFRMAWIGLPDKTDNMIKPVAHAGFEDGYLNQVAIQTGNVPSGKGPTGLAFNSGEIIICNDIATEPLMLPWRNKALKHGYRSSVAVPFKSKGKIIGILNLYASEPGFFTEDERKLLQKIGENISFALNAIDSEKERKNSELLLRVINEELIQINEELVIAKEHAEESDRLKSAFLANMSHEIRTPMNGILGFAGLLKEPKLTGEEQKEYIAIIEKSGTRMLNIINDIITISKVESGQMNILISETSVNEQIEFVYTFFKPEVEQKGMHLCFKNSLTSKESIIKTDKEKVYSILTNLVKNAIKYSDVGTIEIGYNLAGAQGLASLPQPAPLPQPVSPYLQFYVKDTGIGIPSDRQQAIFDRFVQADIGDKRAFQGAGLGLSISKAYVEMLGGRIWLESEEGKGSTFYFTIPYNGEHNAEKAAKTIVKDETVKIQTDPKNPGLKILIAEDDETSGMLIEIAVKGLSKQILKARTGIEAVETCRSHRDIDIVLMDIKMPEIDGYEATKQIRKFNNNVIIIAQTAYALIGDCEKALESGCNDYIAKPFGRATLTAIIEKHLKKQMF